MEWLTVRLAMGIAATAGPGMQVAMEVETNQLPLENTLIILFRKITVLRIPLTDHIVGKFSMEYI